MSERIIMAENSLHPGFVRIYYQDQSSTHKQTIPVNWVAGVLSGNYGLIGANASNVAWGIRVDEWIALLRPMVQATVSFLYAELWQVDFPSGDETFLELHDIGLAGTKTGTNNPTTQTIFSCRTAGGGVAKVALIGGDFALNVAARPPNYSHPAYKAVADYLSASNTWFYGRDGTYVVNVSRVLTKTNDALRKRLLLNQ
jgi:hypothetical protein